jgi:cyclic beta-1,2-glucan synthetase
MTILFGRSAWVKNSALDQPELISSEIFGLDRFRQHARSLAESQKIATSPKPVISIIRRLDENAKALLNAYRDVCAAVAQGKMITPAAEWLIDNYSLIEEQVRQTRADLPSGFYRQLPKIADGILAGHPRIFGLVWAYVAHSDSQFDPATLADFVNEYQKIQPLTIGELWAVAISLRLILIENLKRISQRIMNSRKERDTADRLADALLNNTEPDQNFQRILERIGEPQVSDAFAVQFIQRLRDQSEMATEGLSWLKTKLEQSGRSLEGTVNNEQRRQSAANVTVRNIVTSMRLISDVNWESWFDCVSLVDQMLRTHPTYSAMDFASRTLYRRALEELARGSRTDELTLAKRVLEMKEADPGHYLLGAGRYDFEKSLGFKPTLLNRLQSALNRLGLMGYLGSIGVITVVMLAIGFNLALISSPWQIVVLLLALLIIPGSEFASTIVNFALTKVMRANIIPGLALRDGVTADLRTLVVVPTLLTSLDDIEELIERLEVHFLSNAEGEVYFALLTDWTDATTESKPNDAELLNAAANGIAALNNRHSTNRFFLLHRHRKWNEQQNRWMGWERKRGKLQELNRLLRGATDTSFATISAPLPEAIRYVITLDADTKLPRDAARRLVGKIAHPLNQPIFDDAKKRVTSGFAILQPRVTPSLPVGHYGSMFQRIYSTSRGMDPYVFAVSDVYQDMFGEGSFAGKGIYDIDAFETALAGKIPENSMLSHDLFEGIFARAALVTDVEVVEEFPERYDVAATRQHRWTRGDWQLLPWMIGRMPTSIPMLGMWKMIDNLRRSLNPIATIVSLFTCWLFLPADAAAVWNMFIILLLFVPTLLPAISGALPRKQLVTFSSRAKSSFDDFGHSVIVTVCALLFLAHQAGVMADAIVRTLYRLIVSRRNLLEWTTAAQSASSQRSGLIGSYGLMISSVIAAALVLALIGYRGGSISFVAAPFALAWLLAPAIASWLSRDKVLENAFASSPEDRKGLRLVARRTWRYFETFVTAQDNMLPPDNFQETPKPVIAHRTSPTNIGLYLLSVVSAHQFGWIGLGDAVSRLEATFATIRKLEKYQGHLYNWYDTSDLRTLEPKYVSTVDSGNLAGHLIALSNYCSHWMIQPTDPRVSLNGVADGLDLLLESLAAIPNDRRMLRPLRKQLEQKVTAFHVMLKDAAETPEMISMRLVSFALQASNVVSATMDFVERINTPQSNEVLHWANAARQTVENHFRDTSLAHAALKKRLESLAAEAHELAMSMEFDFLLDPRRQLLSIGYRVTESSRDEGCYDLLASEARLASYFAIAKGDLRTRHWFRLGRPVTAVKGGAALLSWSGSMFEYLMPSLVMRAPSGGLLDQTAQLIVARQMSYAAAHGVPWGISESAFNARDTEFSYQYSNFGVPGLGLKRGLPDNLVIAPYATGLAAMVHPSAAARNYQRLANEGACGIYGFYEALDFTPSRLPPNQTMAVVQAYFAHHQGMTIVALLNAVNEGEVRERFHTEPMVRAAELLLQERAPRDVPVSYALTEALVSNTTTRESAKASPRVFSAPVSGSPATHLLSNGQYHVMLTAAGGGYSVWNGNAITRWREDGVMDDWGSFIYLRDRRAGKIWSAGFAPTMEFAGTCTATFAEEKAEFERIDGNFKTTMECVVSPEDNAEARCITVTNRGRFLREIEITTYAELVLAPAASDEAHPAFSKMFVETEFVPEHSALVATRRRRSVNETEIFVAQFILVKGNVAGDLEFETDRRAFVGRGNVVRKPAAMESNNRLAGTVGAVLDPIFALRQSMKIPAGRQARVTLWTVVANSREAVLDLVDRHRQTSAYDRATMLAWTQAQIQLRHLSISSDEANLYQSLASHVIYANGALRAPSKTIVQDMGPQSALWPQGISGDRPIVLLRIDAVEDIAIVQQLLQAFEYWKAKGLIADLVILNDRMSSYVQDLQAAIDALVRKVSTLRSSNQIYLLRADLTAPETLCVVTSAARVVLIARRGSLAKQMGRLRKNGIADIEKKPVEPKSKGVSIATSELEYFNGHGGFGANGREYVVVLSANRPTPAPWINVIANPLFGFHASAESCGYSWSGNSRENQITPWSNDPVSNAPGEVFYVQDVRSGLLISPTLAPLQSHHGTHVARHGFGFTVYERDVHNLHMELLQIVPLADAVKVARLKITNNGAAPRSLAVTFYADWVLGRSRAAAAPFVTTSIDEQTGAMLARNPWRNQDGHQVAFVDMLGKQSSWTADRREFLGTHGSLCAPSGLSPTTKLSNQVGAGFDPCCALQSVVIELATGQSTDITVIMGVSNSTADAQACIALYRLKDPDDILREVKDYWAQTLNSVQVKTPDRSFDLMMNGWLQYQTLACRMWARSGFYQASGAYGFRDQLQDSMALLTSRPEIAREHILRAASRQFVQGDFQHWWLPATGMGVRTHISDDTVWLVYCVDHYVEVTGDTGILDEKVSFIEGQSLTPQQHDAFFLPSPAEEIATLYEHCARALDHSLATGQHGLPLFGTGDWNDGMNRVGEGGKGESVWLGWFLLHTIKGFTARAITRKDNVRYESWITYHAKLREAMELHGWDGKWYRRGYYDDGSPLGSSQNDECRIDAIAQSWAVISGSAEQTRATQAMEEFYQQLVHPDQKLVQLFTPPFDKGMQDPGYIKAYPPGIRENGGQYTHGVIWSIFAHSMLGQRERAERLFAMINPINHTLTEDDVQKYRVEPYVIAADVYGIAPHTGQGGWTWYTGSAGWMYRAGLEAVLGVTREGNKLRVKPSIPAHWPEAEVSVRFGQSIYNLKLVQSPAGQTTMEQDIETSSPGEYSITLRDDGLVHNITLAVGA